MKDMDIQQRTDGELIELYVQNRNNSESAMQVLIDRHGKELYGRIISKVGNESDANDLQQELWSKVARSLHRYKDEGKFAHYLSRLATNIIIDFYRKTGRNSEFLVEDSRPGSRDRSYDGDDYLHSENYEDQSQNAEQHVGDDQLIEYLTGVLIPALPVEQRTAWLLRHESEYWEPERRLEWHHLAELNGLSEAQTAEIFETARHKLMTMANAGSSEILDELELLVFIVWTQAQRLDKSTHFTWDYFAELLGQPVNTMKTRYRSAQKSLNNSLTEFMKS